MRKSNGLTAGRLLIATGVLLAVLVATWMLYHYAKKFVIDQRFRQAATSTSPSDNAGSGSASASAFSFLDKPRALPDVRFVDGEGHTLTLRDFRGRPVLLNIWATWCVPCRKEMPALDRLQSAIDKSELVVLPLSIDRQGVPVVKRFYQEQGLKALGIYVDQSGDAASDLGTVGVPTTLLVDRDGREVGRKIGPAEWDSPEIVALIREHLGLTKRDPKVHP